MPKGKRLAFVAAASICAATILTSCSPAIPTSAPEKVNCKATQSYADATFWFPNWKPNETRFAGFGGYVCDQNVVLTLKELPTGATTLTARVFYISTTGTENLVGLVNSEKDIKKLGLELIPVENSGVALKAGEEFQVVAALQGNFDVLEHKGLQKKSIQIQLTSQSDGGAATIDAYSNIGTK